MRINLEDKFFVVIDPTPLSTLGDICFETTLRGLELQFRGGLKLDLNPTIFTEKREAELDACGRLLALQVARALGKHVAKGKVIPEPHRLAFYLNDVAAAFHGHWNRGKDEAGLRFIVEGNEPLTLARLALVRGVQQVIASGLSVIGVTPVEEMR